MRKIEIPMWLAGKKLLLADVLKMESCPKSSKWRVCGLRGSGRGFRGMTHLELESKTDEPEGLTVDFNQLFELAESLSDLQDVRITSVGDEEHAFSAEAFDSTVWELQSPN